MLDPWLANRSHPCPEPPDIGLEPMDCLLNKFKELPVRFRGVVERVPYADLAAVRADAALGRDKALCCSRSVIDLMAAFERAGLDCLLACGTVPYGDDPPACEPVADPMGMAMLACFEDADSMDPGFMAPRSPAPFGLVVGSYPDPVAPTCPVYSSSASSGSCAEVCVEVLNGVSYDAGCWNGVIDTVCVCGQAIYKKGSGVPFQAGCGCCGSSSSSESSSESSSSPSSSSAASSASSASSSSVSSSSESSSEPSSSSSSSQPESSSSSITLGWCPSGCHYIAPPAFVSGSSCGTCYENLEAQYTCSEQCATGGYPASCEPQCLYDSGQVATWCWCCCSHESSSSSSA